VIDFGETHIVPLKDIKSYSVVATQFETLAYRVDVEVNPVKEERAAQVLECLKGIKETKRETTLICAQQVFKTSFEVINIIQTNHVLKMFQLLL